MSQKQQRVPEPAQPAEVKRRFQLYRYQWIAIPLLFLVPILAIFGVFGETATTVQSSQAGLELEVQYSDRILFQGLDGTEIAIRNTSDQVLETVTLSIDKAFLTAYSDIAFSPDVDVITDEAYIIELTNLQPGQTQFVTIDSRGKLIGRHRGIIRATVNELSVSVTLDVFIIP
jgi:hypothetical protein